MENKKSNNTGLKVIIAVLALLLLGSLAYMYKLTSDSEVVKNELMSEKDSVLKDLSIANDSLNKAIASNTTLSEELIGERDKIQKLMADIEKSKGDVVAMSKYKVEAAKLRNNVANLMKQVDVLKKENQLLTTRIDSTNVVLKDARKANDTLLSQNDNLAKTVERASKLTVLNLQASAAKQPRRGTNDPATG